MPSSSETSTPGKVATLPFDPAFLIMSFKICAVWSSGSLRLPIRTMLAPASAYLLAIAWPMPVPLPVTTIVLLSNFKLNMSQGGKSLHDY